MALLVLWLGLQAASALDEPREKPAAREAAREEEYQALVKEFNGAAQALWKAATDEERRKVAGDADRLPARFLELAERDPAHPVSREALIQVLLVEIWLENNTLHPGWGRETPGCRAVALLVRHHLGSDRLAEACRRVAYGFRGECETLLRAAMEKSPHREVKGLACLRLAQFLNGRRQRLDLLREQPEMAARYRGLFGKDYLEALERRDRAGAAAEVEALLERAASEFGSVELPFGGTVGEQARSDLYEIRNLSIGMAARDIDGQDQDGKRFKLSDYRGKVVLLYFWSEY